MINFCSMKQPPRSPLAILAGGALLACCASPSPPPAAPPIPPPAAPEVAAMPRPTPLATSTIATAPPLEGADLAAWDENLQAQLTDETRATAELVVLGGTTAWGWSRSPAFHRQWQQYDVLSLSAPGDRTQQVLHRMERGVLDGLRARLVIVLAGRDNLVEGASAADAAAGIRRVVEEIRVRLPATRILVVAALPAGRFRSDPIRQRINATNQALQRLNAESPAIVVDAGASLLSPDGELSELVMGEDENPTPLGYDLLGQTVGLVALGMLEGAL